MKIYFTRRFLTQSNFKVYLNRLEIFVSLLSGALKYSPDVDSCHYFSVDDNYRSGTVNSNTVNSKFHLIRSYCKYLATILSFHV